MSQHLTLFRTDAIRRRDQQFLGASVLTTPLSFKVLSATAAAISLAAICVLCLGHYTRKAVINGQLLPKQGLIQVQSSQAGIVRRRLVNEGQHVRQGDLLFVLSSGRQSASRGDTQAEISKQVELRRDSLRDELAKQHLLQQQGQGALEQKISGLRDEIAQLDQEWAAQERRLELLDKTLRHLEELHASKFISTTQMEDKRAEVLDQQAKLYSLKRNRSSLTRDLAQAQADANALPFKAASEQSSIERDIASAEQELAESEAHRELIVTASEGGIATAVLAEPGQAIAANATLVSIVPDFAVLEARLYANNNAVGFIESGKKVLLRYQAYPFEKFGQHEGVVTSVSRVTVLVQEGGYTGTSPEDHSKNESVYLVTVSLPSQTIDAYGRAQALQAGMQVNAAVLLDRRRLIEWVFEPVLSMSRRM